MLTKVLFAIGVILIALVMSFFGLKEVVATMMTANIFLITVAVLLQLLILALLALRIILIAKKYGKIGFVEAFKISMAGIAISLLTPIAKIGGEPLKIYLLRKRLGVSKATAVIAVDTIAELVSSLLMIFLVFIIFAKDVPGVIFSSFAIFLVIVAALLLGLLKLLLNPGWMRRIIKWLGRNMVKFAKVNKKDYAKLFYNAFRLLIRDKKIMLYAFGVSFATKIIEFVRMWIVFAAIGIFLPPGVVIILWSVILVLYLVPWLPGSLGLVEFFGTGTLIFFGTASGAAAGGLLIDRFISFWFVLIFGLLIATTMKLPKKVRR
ncbi:MAG: flippase-like domain-containing protein [Candidatus Aenigmatarchaeota archaeon]